MRHIKSTIIFLVLTMVTLSSYGQTSDTTKHKTPEQLATLDIMPEFPGGMERIRKIIEDSMIYPESAMKDRIGGKVYTKFIVDTLGNVSDVKVLRGLSSDIDKEAIRLIRLLNGWKPGTQAGKKVNVTYNLPLTFFPDEKWRKKYKKKNK